MKKIEFKPVDVKKLTTAGVMAALIFVLTSLKVPNLTGGYIHLGDSLVFFTSLLVGPFYGFLAAGIGGALADILGGYSQYALPTFFIKGVMSLIVYYSYGFIRRDSKNTQKKVNRFVAILIASAIASGFMAISYLCVDWAFYGFGGALAAVPLNILQGVASTALSAVLLIPVETILLYTMRSK